jgi:hypothetical protein
VSRILFLEGADDCGLDTKFEAEDSGVAKDPLEVRTKFGVDVNTSVGGDCTIPIAPLVVLCRGGDDKELTSVG